MEFNESLRDKSRSIFFSEKPSRLTDEWDSSSQQVDRVLAFSKNKGKHTNILANITKDIYKNPKLAGNLGFKGGTAALFFYNLPRGSVDLDFDLLNIDAKKAVFSELEKIASSYGVLLEGVEKRYTLFFLLSYLKGAKKVKIEVSKRFAKSQYEIKNFFGIPVFVMNKDSMLSNKLCALLSRKNFAARDLFDTWYFLKEGWGFNQDVIKDRLGMSLSDALANAITLVNKVTKNQILHGLGEFVDAKDKDWLRNNLKEELLFQLNLALKS